MSDALDFSILDTLTANRPGGLAQGEQNESGEGIPVEKDAFTTHSRASQGMATPKAAAELQTDAWKAHQEATKRGGALQSEITKGIISGENPARLLLKEFECISLMTGNALFYTQGAADLQAVHGAGLLEPVSLSMELEAVQRRLTMLTRPELDNEPPGIRRNIDAAITAHQQRIAIIENRIQRGKDSQDSRQP